MSLPKLGAFSAKDRDAAISRTGAGISYLIQNKTANDQKCIKATNISALEEAYNNIASELVNSILREILILEKEGKGHAFSNNSVTLENHALNMKQKQTDETAATSFKKSQTNAASCPRTVRLKEFQTSNNSASRYDVATTSQTQPTAGDDPKEQPTAMIRDTRAAPITLPLQKNAGQGTESPRSLSASVDSTLKIACEDFDGFEKHNIHKHMECSILTSSKHKTSETNVCQSIVNNLLNIVDEESLKEIDTKLHRF